MSSDIKNYQINGEEVWQGSLHKIYGRYTANPAHFILRPLNPADAEAMGLLSEKIYENLRKGEECFIHKHSKEYYYDVFKNPNIKYSGVFIGSELIGMSYLKICENAEQLQDELPDAKYDFFRAERNNGRSLIASFGSDSVLPEYRGNSLNAVMVSYRLKQAEMLNCTDCTSIVDRKNRWNMAPYFSCRFNLFATAIDPSDGGKISLLHKPVGKETVLSGFRSRVSLPFERLELIDRIMARGFIGVNFDKEKGEVVFAHSSYYAGRREDINQHIINQMQKVEASL